MPVDQTQLNPLKHPDTDFLRAAAIVLVLNSHLDLYYPVAHIGTGGAIGNSLFFFLSAFGLSLSAQKRNCSFKDWMARRIERIYPSVWLVVLTIKLPAMLFNGEFTPDKVIPFIGYFFFPPFWFLKALLMYCLIFFPLVQHYSRKAALQWAVIMVAGYFTCYWLWIDPAVWSVEKLPFKLLFYLGIFLFGIAAANFERPVSYAGKMDFIKLGASVFIIYLHKLLMVKNIVPELQFIQQAAMFPVVYYALKTSRSPIVVDKILRHQGVAVPVEFLSKHTLEIYIVHVSLSHHILNLALGFPVCLFLFIGLTMIISYAIRRLSESLLKLPHFKMETCS